MIRPDGDAISCVETRSQDDKMLTTFIAPDMLCWLYMTNVMKSVCTYINNQ
jgi:hypothetical protein